MNNIKDICDKQNENLHNKPDKEKALAAARRAAAEMRATKHAVEKEPDQLASGKSDKNGNMIWEEIDHDEK